MVSIKNVHSTHWTAISSSNSKFLWGVRRLKRTKWFCQLTKSVQQRNAPSTSISSRLPPLSILRFQSLWNGSAKRIWLQKPILRKWTNIIIIRKGSKKTFHSKVKNYLTQSGTWFNHYYKTGITCEFKNVYMKTCGIRTWQFKKYIVKAKNWIKSLTHFFRISNDWRWYHTWKSRSQGSSACFEMGKQKYCTLRRRSQQNNHCWSKRWCYCRELPYCESKSNW